MGGERRESHRASCSPAPAPHTQTPLWPCLLPPLPGGPTSRLARKLGGGEEGMDEGKGREE